MSIWQIGSLKINDVDNDGHFNPKKDKASVVIKTKEGSVKTGAEREKDVPLDPRKLSSIVNEEYREAAQVMRVISQEQAKNRIEYNDDGIGKTELFDWPVELNSGAMYSYSILMCKEAIKTQDPEKLKEGWEQLRGFANSFPDPEGTNRIKNAKTNLQVEMNKSLSAAAAEDVAKFERARGFLGFDGETQLAEYGKFYDKAAVILGLSASEKEAIKLGKPQEGQNDWRQKKYVSGSETEYVNHRELCSRMEKKALQKRFETISEHLDEAKDELSESKGEKGRSTVLLAKQLLKEAVPFLERRESLKDSDARLKKWYDDLTKRTASLAKTYKIGTPAQETLRWQRTQGNR